jgi:hypothetical protein
MRISRRLSCVTMLVMALLGGVLAQAASAKSLEFSGVSCATSESCIAVGLNAPTTTLPLAEKWNGKEWTLLTTVAPEFALAGSVLLGVSCASSEACMAVGEYKHMFGGETVGSPLAEFWNGKTWSILTPLNPTELHAGTLDSVSCPTTQLCIVAGSLRNNTTKAVESLSEKWTSTGGWTILKAPGMVEQSVSCGSTESCVAVGRTSEAKLIVAHWDGKEWATQTTGLSELAESVSCKGSECVIVGGVHGAITSNAGKEWTLVTMAAPEKVSFILTGVSCPTALSSCFAVGGATNELPLAERSSANHKEWSILTTPALSKEAPNGIFQGVSCVSTSACVAVGGVFGAGVTGPLAEKWNGTEWTILKPV